MADALASGASVRKDVGVQVPPSAPKNVLIKISTFFLFVFPFHKIQKGAAAPNSAAAPFTFSQTDYSSSCKASKPSAPVRTLMTFSTS